MRSVVVVVGVLGLAGCADSGARDKVTVILEADRARAEEDQARLAQMQRALDDAKAALVSARGDLSDLRERLIKAGAISADEAKKLEEREAHLAAAGPPVSAGGVSKAELEAMLAAHDDRLRASLASVPAPAPAVASGSDDGAAGSMAAAARIRAERGLKSDDVPDGPKLERRVDDAVKAHHGDDAVVAARALLEATSKVSVDAAFVRKKYQRVTAQLDASALPEPKKAEVKRLLGEAVHDSGGGNAGGANEKLNAALDVLYGRM